MNNFYSFILGHASQLSQAEIESILRFKKIDFKIKEITTQFLILETKNDLDIENLISILGGTIKIGRLEFYIDKLDNIENLENSFIEIIKKNCNLDKKIKFGFSLYEYNKHIEKFIYRLAINIKKRLKLQGVNSRIVTSKNINLSAVIIKKEHLISAGFDMQVLRVGTRYYFFRTLGIQDFTRFNALDYERPRIDAQSGMMPPKLAKIMLNLTENRGMVLDPFCGSGTILLMASELGFKKVIGADISAKAVADSQENLKWYQERFNKQVHNYVFKSDVLNILEEGIEKDSLDAIVSEGYLGKPLHGNESLNFIHQQINMLENLYIKSLQIFAQVLKSRGLIVISLPIFHLYNKDLSLDILDKIKEFNLELADLLAEQKTLVYKREQQKVYRQILKLKKV